jgi:putative SOS response-associated peptidase YedK
MCGRYTRTTSLKELAEIFGVSNVPETEERPRYNIAPTQTIAAVRQSQEEGGRAFARMRWGLIPNWAKDAAIGAKMCNARAETVTEKPSFREPFKRRRCLIPADGFYEWQRQGGRKQPFLFRMKDGRPFAFAGLWDVWGDGEGEDVETCTILTTEANELLAPVHDRMPVILDASSYRLWLDPSVSKPDVLLPLLAPFPSERMATYPVSTLVNNVSNDAPSCIEPKSE